MNPPNPQQAMITDEFSLFVFLLALVGALFFISELKPFRRFFGFVPPLVFCYFLPMFTTTFGITPEQNPLYGWANRVFVPPILLLLLLSADIKAILRLGPKAVGIFLAGTFGIIIGASAGYAMLHNHLDANGWKNVASLAASWTGGSANMFAVASALELPDVAPMVVVDAVMSYSWMGLLIALAGWQTAYTRRFRVDQRIMDSLAVQSRHFEAQVRRPITTRDFLVIIAIAFGVAQLCILGGRWTYQNIVVVSESARLTLIKSILETFSTGTLTIVFATIAGVALSFTPVRRLEEAGASRLGYALLYLLLPTFGAQANLSRLGEIPYYGLIGVVMLLAHGVMVFGAMWLFRAPLFLGATGSQANIGGPASAAVVASAHQPPLAPVGVLLGILGGVAGTFVGLAVAQICRFIAP